MNSIHQQMQRGMLGSQLVKKKRMVAWPIYLSNPAFVFYHSPRTYYQGTIAVSFT